MPEPQVSITQLGQFRKALLEFRPAEPKHILSDEEMQHYLEIFKQGMQGPLNYYRTGKQRFEEERAAKLPSSLREDVPVLFIYGSKDPSCNLRQVQRSLRFIPQMQQICLEDKGHWLMIECQDEVTNIVARWIQQRVLIQGAKL